MVDLILEKPEICRYCGGKVIFTSNSEIYGKEYGNGKCFLCTNCRAYVGVHTETLTPLGTLANNELRKWRHKTHIVFDTMWKNNKMKRNDAYKWLAEKMSLTKDECHIALFEVEQCKQAIKLVEEKTKC